MKTRLLIPVLAGLIAAGCSKPPQTFGDELSTRGDKAAAIGKAWNNDNKKMADGEKVMNKGQTRLDEARQAQADAETTVAEGRLKVNEAKQSMRNGEAEYQKMRAVPAVTPVQPQAVQPAVAAKPVGAG